jgi:hypothetical protein
MVSQFDIIACTIWWALGVAPVGREGAEFREGKSRMVQRQQQIWENPVREKHYSLFC